MVAISGSAFWRVLVALLVVSAIANVLLYNRLNQLKEENTKIDRRLMVFADVTATIVKEGNVFRSDALRSGMITYPPHKAGKGYLIDLDEHFEQGILLQFDAQNKIIGWQEYPPAKRRKQN